MERKFFQEPNTFVSNVVIKVQDLSRSIQFYQDVIGLKVLQQSDKRAMLTANGKTAILTLEQPEDVVPKQARTTGLYHFAILVPNRLELAKVLKHFIELDVELGASDHLVSEALYLSDPDGNGIEVYTDRDASTWTWQHEQVKMAVDPLDATGILAELQGEPWQGLPADTVMGHIHLHVSELSKTKAFYQEALGFDVVCQFGSQALFISTGGYHHHIGLNTWNGVGAPAPDENSVGLKHFTLTFPSSEVREQKIDQLKMKGYRVEEQDGAVYTFDPSNNQMELAVVKRK